MDVKRHVLIIEPISKRLDIADGTSIFDALLALNYPIGTLCGGNGTCGKCMIKIPDYNSANLSEPTQNEIKALGEVKIKDGYRLACQTKIYGDSRIFLINALMSNKNRILVDSDMKSLGINEKISLRPLISSEFLIITPSTINNPQSDYTNLVNAILESKVHNISWDTKFNEINDGNFNIIKKLPKIMRENKGGITVYFKKDLKIVDKKSISRWDIYDVEKDDRTEKMFGLAVDIGTTTIVGYLINLTSGETASISALLNPQVGIGEDLISRIMYIKENDAIEKGKKIIVDAINQILQECCQKVGITAVDVKDITIVGNTGMHHMFFGIPSEYLAVSPYVPVFKSPINVKAESLGLMCSRNVNVYSPPVIAGFVGTDTIGCILSSRIDTYEKYSLLIDIGTNGELVLGNRNGLVTASCAAGSALEGAHISFGMRASDGAIETVSIDKETLEPSLGIIGETNPIGICGSGIIDTAAEMLKSRIITRSGKFNTKSDKIRNSQRIFKNEAGYCYLLYDIDLDKERFDYNDKKNTIKRIFISQGDIQQLQLAKGAFLSAAFLMLDLENRKDSEIEQGLAERINRIKARR